MIKQPKEKISYTDKWFVRVLACAVYLILAFILDQYFRQDVAVFGRPDGYLQDRIGITDNILAAGFGLLFLALIFSRVCSLLLKTARFFFRLAQLNVLCVNKQVLLAAGLRDAGIFRPAGSVRPNARYPCRRQRRGRRGIEPPARKDLYP
jgi:hypothetical protein